MYNLVSTINKETIDIFSEKINIINKKVVDYSMQRTDEIIQHGDKAKEILTTGIEMTSKMLLNAMQLNTPEILEEQIKWALVRLPVDNVKPQHIYNRFQIYKKVLDEELPEEDSTKIKSYIDFMLQKINDFMTMDKTK